MGSKMKGTGLYLAKRESNSILRVGVNDLAVAMPEEMRTNHSIA